MVLGIGRTMTSAKAIKAINTRGALLVFPLQNRKAPLSLWGEFFPRSKMKWEWDESGDSRVSDLWILREELSRSKKVVYSKWYRGRATFFSKEVFISLLAVLAQTRGLSRSSLVVLQALQEESPLSTKALKKKAKLQGHALEAAYHKALKPLWNRGLIVGFGEVDEGAFPSLAMGSTQLLFEELWNEAQALGVEKAKEFLEKKLKGNELFLKELGKYLKEMELSDETNLKKGVIRGTDLYLE